MSLIHPAFSAIADPELSEALSAPFVNPDEYTVFSNQRTFAAEEMVPFVFGAVVVRGENLRFAAGLSQHSTTPLNHTVEYLDRYRTQVGRAQASVFEDGTDGPKDLELVEFMQRNIVRIAKEDRLKVVSGFMLGLAREPQMTVAGLVIGKRALETMHQVVEKGLERAEPVFRKSYEEKVEDWGKKGSTRRTLLATAKELSTTASVARLLPTRQAVRGALIDVSPAMEEFYARTGKAQSKVLRAERIAASNFN